MLPEEIRRTIPPLHSSQETASDPIVYARLTSPLDMTWYVLELDAEDQDTFLAYMLDSEGERFGYYAFSYLEEQLPNLIPDEPVPLQYDPTFTPILLSEAIRQEHEAMQLQGMTPPGKRFNRPYYYAVRYTGAGSEGLSQRAYTHLYAIQEPLELSFHRFLKASSLNWYVVVFGDRPTESIHRQIMQVLSTGEATTIPFELLVELMKNRSKELRKGNRVEKHRNIVLKRRQPTYPAKYRQGGKKK